MGLNIQRTNVQLDLSDEAGAQRGREGERADGPSSSLLKLELELARLRRSKERVRAEGFDD